MEMARPASAHWPRGDLRDSRLWSPVQRGDGQVHGKHVLGSPQEVWLWRKDHALWFEGWRDPRDTRELEREDETLQEQILVENVSDAWDFSILSFSSLIF